MLSWTPRLLAILSLGLGLGPALALRLPQPASVPLPLAQPSLASQVLPSAIPAPLSLAAAAPTQLHPAEAATAIEVQRQPQLAAAEAGNASVLPEPALGLEAATEGPAAPPAARPVAAAQAPEGADALYARELLRLIAATDFDRADRRLQLAAQLRAQEAELAQTLASQAGLPVIPKRQIYRRRDSDGRWQVAIGVTAKGAPVWAVSENQDAAHSLGTDLVREEAAFDFVDGAGSHVLVHDAGSVRQHVAFADGLGGSRIHHLLPPLNSSHSDHVAGTLIAGGGDARLRGMAPAAEAWSSVGLAASNTVGLGRRDALAGGLCLVANASLGSGTFATAGDGGGYTAIDASWDALLAALPYHLQVFSAGNSGPQFDTITGTDFPKEIKNGLIVGAVDDVSRNSSGQLSSGVSIASFSSRGPVDDGRIRPDLVANGVGLLSTVGVNSLTSMSGTSMASPNLAGSALLLQDLAQRRLGGQYLRAASLRGLLIHTADDLGAAGPDYLGGWGLANIHAAAGFLNTLGDGDAAAQLYEDSLTDGDELHYTFGLDSLRPLRLTLSWWDPPLVDDGVGTPEWVHGRLDDRRADLVHDLDLRLRAPDGSEFLPWQMPFVAGGFQLADRSLPATAGDNITDNLERIDLPLPTQTGVWTVVVRHKGSLPAAQPFSLLISGADPGSSLPALQVSGLQQEWQPSQRLRLRLTGSGLLPGTILRVLRPGSPPLPVDAIQVGARLLEADLEVAALASGVYDLEVRRPDGVSLVLASALDRAPPPQLLLDESFESGLGEWSSAATQGSDQWQISDTQASHGSQSCMVVNAATTVDSHLRSPTIAIPAALGTPLYLRFDQRLFLESGFDGIVAELQIDGGTWQDLTELGEFLSGEYIVALGNGPLNGRPAWTGVSGTFLTTVARLPAAPLAGRSLRLRFRLSCDDNTALQSWHVDRVQLSTEVPDTRPHFTSLPPTVATADLAYDVVVAASDGQGGTDLALSAPSRPSWLGATPLGDGELRLHGTPPNSVASPQLLTLLALRNSDGAAASHSLSLRVNQTPQLELADGPSGPLGVPDADHGLILQLQATDDSTSPDELLFAWQQTSGPDTAQLLTPDPSRAELRFPTAGTYTIEASATDADGASGSISFNIVVGPERLEPAAGVVNQAPRLNTSFPTGTLHAGSIYPLALSVEDDPVPDAEPRSGSWVFQRIDGGDPSLAADQQSFSYAAAGGGSLRASASDGQVTSFKDFPHSVGPMLRLRHLTIGSDAGANESWSVNVPAEPPLDVPGGQRFENLDLDGQQIFQAVLPPSGGG